MKATTTLPGALPGNSGAVKGQELAGTLFLGERVNLGNDALDAVCHLDPGLIEAYGAGSLVSGIGLDTTMTKRLAVSAEPRRLTEEKNKNRLSCSVARYPEGACADGAPPQSDSKAMIDEKEGGRKPKKKKKGTEEYTYPGCRAKEAMSLFSK